MMQLYALLLNFCYHYAYLEKSIQIINNTILIFYRTTFHIIVELLSVLEIQQMQMVM